MENLIKEHLKAFNKEPYIIGMFWDNPTKLEENIINAIETNKPYNEYDLLREEDKKAFDNGDLVF